MTSSFTAAKDYSAGAYRRGSTLATSVAQGDPGPSPFAPGTVTPGAAIVKFAHAFLSAASRRRARDLAQSRLDTQDKEEQDYRDKRLQLEQDRVTAYQQHLTHMDQKPQGAQPKKVHVFAPQAGEMNLPGEGDYDAGTVTNAAALRGQSLTDSRAAKAAEKKAGSMKRYMQAQAALKALDDSRKHSQDDAESSVRTTMADQFDMGRRFPKSSPAYERVWGLAPGTLTGKNSKGVPADAGALQIKNARDRAGAAHDRANAANRAKLQKVITDEAGVVLSSGDEQGSPSSTWAQGMMNALGVGSGGGGGGADDGGTERLNNDDGADEQP